MLLCELPSGTINPAKPVRVTLEDGRSYDEVSKIMINHCRGSVSILTLTSDGHDMSRNLSSQENIEILDS